MNSTERREARYQRRKARREQKRAAFAAQFTLEGVFSYGNVLQAALKCCKGVGWKRSTQNFRANLLLNVYTIQHAAVTGTFKSRGFYEFDIFERGKPRHIKSVHITERVLQRCLCDNFLVPILRRGLIYDNGASLKGRGVDFAVRRFCKHLREHYRKYGPNAPVVVYDFSDYFNTINHEKALAYIYRRTGPGPLYDLTAYLIRNNSGTGVGLGLGSQVNQITAVSYPSPLDHYYKDTMRIGGYAHYMDDGYGCCIDRQQADAFVSALYTLCGKLELTINPKKIHVLTVRQTIVFLKVRAHVEPSGKVVRKICRKNVTTERRKLKRLRRKLDAGAINQEIPRCNFASWTGYTKRFHAHKTRRRMESYYRQLFIEKE